VTLVGYFFSIAAVVAFDAPLEPSPQPEDDERGLVERLAQKLAEQLTRFQGCCNDCHQTAKECRMQSPAEQISLAQYLESTAGKVNAECRKKIFCGVDSESEAPLICLGNDERVSRTAGVTFDVDSIIGFPSSLSVVKRGIRWFPTRMTVSDLQSDLHLRSFTVTYFDADGVQCQVHRPVHQVPHYTFVASFATKTFSCGWMAYYSQPSTDTIAATRSSTTRPATTTASITSRPVA
ncbi:hypothetical protein GGI35DRAFT_465187, partial [Trichoderma velutinum]